MFNIEYEQSEAASKALSRIKDRRVVKSNAAIDNCSAISRERGYLEEFSETSLEMKLKSDKYIYESILSKVDNNDQTAELFGQLIAEMTTVYKVLNVAPVPYKFEESDIINNTESDNAKQASEIVESYMRDNLYRISVKDRDSRYKEAVTKQAQIFTESFDVDSPVAVDLAYKTVIIENMLTTVHFPKFVKLYLEDCLSSDKYAEFFESDVLVDAFNSYKDTVHVTAQLIATTI